MAQTGKNREIGYVVAAHSLTEVYSVLTSAPFKPRICPSTANRLIEQNIKNDANIISLSKKDYFQVIETMDQLGLKGGLSMMQSLWSVPGNHYQRRLSRPTRKILPA